MTAPLPPPLSSLQGTPQYASVLPRDLPVLANSWGSVGTANDLLGLSQVLLPPYLDQGVPTATLSYANPSSAPACSPETAGPYVLQGAPVTQTFTLTSANASLRTYSLTCTGSDCTSWVIAEATSAAPFATFAITYHELPPHAPFSDVGTFSPTCQKVTFASSPGAWCAVTDPQCTASPGALPLQGWQWSPTSVLRWGGPALSETRMAFEGNAVLQSLTLTPPPSAPLPPLQLQLTPAIRAYPRSLGWTTHFPMSTAGYVCELTGSGGGGLMACDASASGACAVWVLASTTGLQAQPTWSLPAGSCTATLLLPQVPAGAPPATLALALVIGANASQAAAEAAALVGSPEAWQATWQAAADAWQERWEDAFTPKGARGGGGGGGHFSGSLPVLQMEATAAGAALQRMYYMACYAILAHERTNLPLLAPRVYLTGTGNAYSGYSIGGTMQFAWDQTFYGTLFALLDPAAAAADLAAWIGQPIASHFGIELDNLQAGGDFYAFNSLSLFRAFSTYLRATGDLASPFSTKAQAYMALLADFYLPYAPPGSTLADYSGDPNNYLECLPTYRHATAGLQGGNAYMALDLAQLLAAQGSSSGAGSLRARAAAIANETLAAAYISSTTGARGGAALGDVGGWWRVVDVRGGGAQSTEVRHCVDFAYSAMGFASPRFGPPLLNASVGAQMVDFFQRQLALPGGGWMRALSELDSAAPISRPDHGSTGAYDAWPAMAADALAALSGNFVAATPFLVGVAGAAEEGPYGQAHGVSEDGGTVFKTTEGWTRYQANNGAAFAESLLVTWFGYSPEYSSSGNSSSGGGGALPTPLLQGADRGVRGSLSCIQGPGSVGYTTATLTSQGVQYSPWSEEC